ncbi:MAG: DnaJ domain-containing protein [Verrucomicrobia bacterium]|nr:DnaJ domain-containing protein [Verrucomicrobiota bacterium]
MNEILRCFRVLGVQPDANGKVVKKAYRDLVKKWHPDQFGDDPARRTEAEEKLREINIAFDRIRNTPPEELSRAVSPKPAPQQPRPAPDSKPTSARPTKGPSPRKRTQPQPSKPPKPPDPGPARRPVKKARRSVWEVAFAIALGAGVLWLWYALLVPSESVRKRKTVRTVSQPALRPELSGPQNQADAPFSNPSASRSEMNNGADGGSGGTIVSNVDRAETVVGGPGEAAADAISGLAGQAAGGFQMRSESFVPSSLGDVREAMTPPDSGSPGPVISEALRVAITPPPASLEPPKPTMTEAAEADFQKGMEFAEGRGVARDYEQAAVWYRRAAEGGHPVAQRRLGMLYATGKGVGQDSREAETWLERSAGGGDADASLVNGLLVLARSSASEPKPVVRSETATPAPASGRSPLFKELMNRADGGAANPPARVSEADPGEAVSAVETDPQRQYERGLRHAAGEGAERDYSESAKWFRMAADAGHAEAQKQLGLLYASGKGVPQDYLEAEKWLRKAAEKGAVGAVLSKGGAPKDPSPETEPPGSSATGPAPASEIAVDPLKKGS